MNRQELERAVYRDFGYADSPASAVSTRIQGYLNDRHRRLTTLPGLEIFRRETATLALTASTATYSLAMPIQKIVKVVDTTNDQPLYERSLSWYRHVDPDPQTGTQEYWIPLRWSPALRDIGGTGLWVVSSSATDSNVNVNVETIDANNSLTATTANTDGTTRVQVGTATNHQRLLRFSADAAAVGVLSLYDAATSGNQVSVITLGRTNANFLVIALWPTPAAADTLRLDYITWIRDFSQAYDEPQLPHDFHYLVSLGGKIDEARKKGSEFRQQRMEWQVEYEAGLRNLYAFTTINERVIVPGELSDTGRSNLGPAFPSGTW